MSDNYKRVCPFNDDTWRTNYCGIITITREIYSKETRDKINSLVQDNFISMIKENFIKEYFFILHNENNNNIHIHYVIKLVRNYPITYTCNKIGKFFNINPICITIDELISLSSMLDYFVHDEEIDKVQYPREYIISNYDLNYISCLMDTNDKIDIDSCLELCYNCNNLIQVMQYYGIKTYHKYRYEIRDIWEYSRETLGLYRNEN